ncbi:MAG: Uma2 family endonuclease [Bacteroidales bacterium]|nr:Uma2 family endonuclease [Bacteroidales bacterium]
MEVRKTWEEERFMEIKGGKGYTIADIEALPEGERAELIDGEMFRMDTPTWVHQMFQMAISATIWNYIRERKGKCRVLPAPFAVYIKKDNRNYVEPDISVICDMEKKSEKGCQGAPDWAIEIVSPSSVKMDYERKVKLYREAGVREYWIVDTERETITVYDFEHGKEAAEYAFSERIKAGIFEDLELCLSELDVG